MSCFNCFGKKDNALESCTIENTPELTFKGDTKKCKILSVYDGDTCTITFNFNDKYYKWKCRLYGINSPEIRTLDKTEKNRGYEARDYLKSRIDGKIVTITFHGFEKYGRLLGTIYLDGININQEMIEKKYAVSYMATK